MLTCLSQCLRGRNGHLKTPFYFLILDWLSFMLMGLLLVLAVMQLKLMRYERLVLLSFLEGTVWYNK